MTEPKSKRAQKSVLDLRSLENNLGLENCFCLDQDWAKKAEICRVNYIYIQFILKYYVNIHVDYKYYKKSKLVVKKTKLGI